MPEGFSFIIQNESPLRYAYLVVSDWLKNATVWKILSMFLHLNLFKILQEKTGA